MKIELVRISYKFKPKVVVRYIGQHVKNIVEEGELDRNSVVKFFFTTAADGKNYNTEHLNFLFQPPPLIQIRFFKILAWTKQIISTFFIPPFIPPLFFPPILFYWFSYCYMVIFLMFLYHLSYHLSYYLSYYLTCNDLVKTQSRT